MRLLNFATYIRLPNRVRQGEPLQEVAPTLSEENKAARKYLHARLLRREKIQRVSDAAVRRWQNQSEHYPDELALASQGATGDHPQAVQRPLPRPPALGSSDREPSSFLPRRHGVHFKGGLVRSVGRLMLWTYGALFFLIGVLWDKLRGRDTEDQRARRLRVTFETMGTTFIKFGQQLSMRLDLLPYAYTRELAEMLDNLPAFDVQEAIKTIERVTRQPLSQTFSAFDPVPIGSASVACVYQAVLKNGERVAVKVRRPGIIDLLAADLRALGWLLSFLELTVLRPGFTENFLSELKMMLAEELDFVQEARFTDLFGRSLRKTKQLKYASTPRVYFEISGIDVLVMEFVSGIWLKEILSALETDDLEAQVKLREMNIDPVILARRFLLVSRFGNFENIFFHADLHPANILVQPGNKIILIDFGSCGSLTKRELTSWRRVFDAQYFNDVGGMVQAAMGVMEPLPPIDKDQLALQMEAKFWNNLYATKSKHADWSERVSAGLWIDFLKIAREYGIPMRLNMLRMIRAIMLADTIAARLDHDLDPYREYRFYEKGAGKRAKKRTAKALRRLSGPNKFVRIERGMESVLNAIYQIERALHSISSIRILPLIGKSALVVYMWLKAACLVGASGSLIALFLIFTRYHNETFVHVLVTRVLASGYFQLLAILVVLPSVRQIFFRLKDPEYN